MSAPTFAGYLAAFRDGDPSKGPGPRECIRWAADTLRANRQDSAAEAEALAAEHFVARRYGRATVEAEWGFEIVARGRP